MESFYQNTKARCILALVCCALWGSAFPCIKVGYEWFHIEGAASQVLFAGYRFFLAGIFTFLISCVLEKRWVVLKRSSVPYVFAQGILQTTVQYICFYIGLAHTTGAKGSVINASNAFFSIFVAHFLLKSERITWKKAAGGNVYGFTVRSTVLLIYMALLSTVAFTLWAELIKYNPVGKVAIFGFSIPVFGVGLSAIFLGENVWTVQNLAALVLVSVGIFIVNLPEKDYH